MKLHVGGVPEHFNLPWHWAWENQHLAELPIAFDWKSYPNGTGAMCQDLRSGDLDIAVILSEGILQDIQQGNPSKVVALYVNSPLRWGVHAPANSNLSDEELLRTGRYAISRRKSGSHLMAHVHADAGQRILDEDKDFVLVENLEGARKSFAAGESELFLWERFTTKHLVDSGEFKHIGDCYTPWPSFVIAVREEVLAEREAEIHALIYYIQELAGQLAKRADIIQILSVKYGLKPEDAEAWFSKLEWNTGEWLPKDTLVKMLSDMKHFQLLPDKAKAEDYLAIGTH
ncbi:MAG: ABC transporter substrate-binding protein [Bacteroidetes bacterium]|nr:MAG: ABC transporter substrate-binding protein [Bacteroidota bacterium]